MKTALTIAGSDSGGGAGIQADLLTFAALGVYGTSAITAVTAQNTLRVSTIYELPPSLVAAQIDAIMTDIGADAVKTGMLSSTAIIEVVIAKAREYRFNNLVIDPVMVAGTGAALLRAEALEALRCLIALARVVTPNLPEAAALAETRVESEEGIRAAAQRIHALGAENVVITGGHRPGEPVDLLYDGHTFRPFSGQRVGTPHTHGTGCTFAAAIAAWLAKGSSVEQATAAAKEYVTRAILKAPAIGHGHRPLHHFLSPESSLRPP